VVDEPVRGGLPEPSFYALSGIDQARDRLQGLVPRSPLSHLVGYRLTQIGSGTATMTMPASPWFQMVDGITLGAPLVVEEAPAIAVLTGAPSATEVVITALSLNHFRPPTLDSSSFIARARVVNTGSTFTVAEVLVEDALGRSVMHATGSFVLRPLDPIPPPCKDLVPVAEPSYPTPDPYLRPPPAGDFIWRGLTPLEGARRVIAGECPPAPVWELFGARMVDVAEGSLTFALNASPWLCSRSDELAPSVLTAMLHDALGGAAWTLATATQNVGIASQSLTFLRSLPLDRREILIRSRLVHQGSELLVSTVEAVDADGNQVAFGTQTSRLVEIRKRSTSDASTRVVTTVMFTDIVGSTNRAEELGDDRWRELLAEHDALVRRQLELFKGREVKTTGDGVLATFDSPGRAVQCARGIREGLVRLGLHIRVGLHTGECEVSGADVAGIAVHIASRIQGLAGPGEILVSGTVRDLVTGSGLRFADRGRHPLKGIEGGWPVFAVEA
jgi:class 3 adenylate cyclase